MNFDIVSCNRNFLILLGKQPLPSIKTEKSSTTSYQNQVKPPEQVHFPNIEAKDGGWGSTNEEDAQLTVPQDEWDELRYRASVVLEENQVRKKGERGTSFRDAWNNYELIFLLKLEKVLVFLGAFTSNFCLRMHEITVH